MTKLPSLSFLTRSLRLANLRSAVAVAVATACLAPVGASFADAADVTFVMRNSHQFRVQVELYSQTRNHVWPGNNKVYILDDSETKRIPLSCESGEQICYGAWVDGDATTYWGVGPNNKENCEDCCYICQGGNTETINLVE
jgi:hypothetical protein